MPNDYLTATERVVSVLTAALTLHYPDIVIERRHWAAGRLPTFTRYAVIVSPAQTPIEERRLGVGNIQYIVRADIYMLVKNWSATQEEPALWGTTGSGTPGIFELIEDVKNTLRLSDLDGLLDKTYDEAGGDSRSPGQGGGPVEFGSAIPGFAAGEFMHVYPARLRYVARIRPFCHTRIGV